MSRLKIDAYHQVGNSSAGPEEQRDLFDIILDDGQITPAIDRISKSEMEKECFSGEDTDSIGDVFASGTPVARRAIRKIAESVIARLPDVGTSSTDFNCKDMLAGEFNRIFLSFGGFYSGIENGFVFDAADLIERGARLRPVDMLFEIVQAVKRASKRPYKDVSAAERGIKSEIDRAFREMEMVGSEAMDFLSIFKKEREQAELVWEGPLSLDLSKGAWRAGKRVRI